MLKRKLHNGFWVCFQLFWLIFLFNQVKINAQSCPTVCFSETNFSIGLDYTSVPKCLSEIEPKYVLNDDNLTKINACVAALGSNYTYQTQIFKGSTWTPALGAGNATVNANDVGIRYRVRVVVFKIGSTTEFYQSCEGLINIQDKAPPICTRPKNVVLFCNSLDLTSYPDQKVTGDLGLDGTSLSVDGTADDCTPITSNDEFFTDCDFTRNCNSPFTTINIPVAGRNDAIFDDNSLTDHCGIDDDNAAILWNEINAAVGSTPGIIRIIIRAWRVRDRYNNEPSTPCYQIIFVRQPTLDNLVCPTNKEYTCFTADSDCNLSAAPVGLLPADTGAPYLDLNGLAGFQPNSTDILLLPGTNSSCNIIVSYTDNEIPICTGSKKVLRTWTIKDCCLGTTKTCDQEIKVLDTREPMAKASYIDYKSKQADYCYIDQWGIRRDLKYYLPDAEYKTDVFFTGKNKLCGYSDAGKLIELTALADVNTCGRAFVKFSITVCDPHCTGGLVDVFSNVSSLTKTYVGQMYDNDLKVISYTYEFKGFITDIGSDGYEDIKFTATDECKYATALQTFRVKIYDNAAPQVNCISFTTAAVGTDGTVKVYASTFNNGSRDNCALDKMMVRRTDGKKCANSSDGCAGKVNDDACYRDYVEFGCCDVGETIMVELLVLDQAGNWNTCMVNVLIQNKQPATCIAPSERTVSCKNIELKLADLEGYFGKAAAFYNCGYTLAEIAVTNNLDNCKTGTLVRTWQVKDCNNNVLTSCQQKINVTGASDFTVDFPDDVEVNCASQIPDTATLKAQMLDPLSWSKGLDGAIKNDGCGLIKIAIKDDTLIGLDGSFKILRKICVYDCCKYNPNNDLTDSNANAYGEPVCGDKHGYAGGSRATNMPTWDALDAWRKDCNGDNIIDATNSATSRDISRYDRRFRDADDLIGPPNVGNPLHPNSFSDGVMCFIQIIKVNGGTDLTITNQTSPIAQECPGTHTVQLLATAGTCRTGTVTYQWRILNNAGTEVANGTTSNVTYNYPNYGDYTIKWSASQGGYTLNGKDIIVNIGDHTPPQFTTIDIPFLPDAGSSSMTLKFENLVDLTRLSDNCVSPAVLIANGLVKLKTEAESQFRSQLSVTLAAGEFVEISLKTTDARDNEARGTARVSRPNAQISGLIQTENGIGVANVNVNASNLSGINPQSAANTDVAGSFKLVNLLAGQDYIIKPSKASTEDKYVGISSYDISVINAHLLNIKKITSPYALIAADIDGSGEVDVADMLLLRSFILRRSDKLPQGVWRFIDKKYQFKDITKPFAEDFPEQTKMNLQKGDNPSGFVAVKIGDVYTTTSSTPRQVNNVVLSTEDVRLEAGSTYTITIKTEETTAKSVQGTLSLRDAKLKSVESNDLSVGNFALFDNAATMSWNNTPSVGNTKVFKLTFIAQKTGFLSEILSLNSNLTSVEAVDEEGRTLNVSLKFNDKKSEIGEFALYQNTPNPANDETFIAFNLPKASAAKLTIYNTEGKTVKIIEGQYPNGLNKIRVEKGELQGNGLYYYRLDTPDYSATKRMVWID